MLDTFVPTLSAARRILATRGPLTPDKVRAADLYAEMARAEPIWPAWIAADIAVGLVTYFATPALARACVVVYALAYAYSVTRISRGDLSVLKVSTEANPERAAHANSLMRFVNPVTYVTAVLMVVVSLVIVMLPQHTFQWIGACFTVLAVRHAYRRVTAHVRSARVLAEAPSSEWFPAYAVDRELRLAAAAVLLHPQG